MGISVASLLEPISPDSPCGEELSESDDQLAMLALEQAFEGRPEMQMGDSVREAEDPDWADIQRQATQLLGRSRDLRLIVHLTVALMMTDGAEGLDDGLRLLEHAVVEQWPDVHPRLDPDDHDDPTERINILASLVSPPGQAGDPVRFRTRFRSMPLLRSSAFGSVSLLDVQRAGGGAGGGDDGGEDDGDGDGAGAGGHLDATTLQAAAMDADLAQLVETADQLAAIRGRIAAVDASLTDHVGASSAVDFGPVLQEVGEALAVVRRWLALRGHATDAGTGDDPAASAAPASSESAAAAAPAPAAAAAIAAAPAPPAGTVATPEDVRAGIARILDYYRASEPSSPVPLVLEAARSLVGRDFIEISGIMTPDAVHLIQQIKDGQADG